MDFINTMTFAQILSEAEENAKLVFHETNLTFPVKDEDIVEEGNVFKKTRKVHSYNKGDRAQMKKDSAMKRAKALGIEGNPEEGSDFYIVLKKAKRNMNAKEKGRHFYNTVEKCGHAVDFSREEKRKNAEKHLSRYEEDFNNSPWQCDFVTDKLEDLAYKAGCAAVDEDNSFVHVAKFRNELKEVEKELLNLERIVKDFHDNFKRKENEDYNSFVERLKYYEKAFEERTKTILYKKYQAEKELKFWEASLERDKEWHKDAKIDFDLANPFIIF